MCLFLRHFVLSLLFGLNIITTQAIFKEGNNSSTKNILLKILTNSKEYNQGEFVFGEITVQNNTNSEIMIPAPNQITGGLKILLSYNEKNYLNPSNILCEGSEDSIVLNPGEGKTVIVELTSSFGKNVDLFASKKILEEGEYSVSARLGDLQTSVVKFSVKHQEDFDKEFSKQIQNISYKNTKDTIELKRWRKLININSNSKQLHELYLKLFSIINITWKNKEEKGIAIRKLAWDYMVRFPDNDFNKTVLYYYKRSFQYQWSLQRGLNRIINNFQNRKIADFAQEALKEIEVGKI